MRLRECTATRTQRAATPRTLLYQHGRQPRWSSRSSTRASTSTSTCWVCDARVLSCRSLTPHPRASVHHHTQPRESAPRSKPRAFSFSLSRFFAARAARAGSSTSSRVAVSLVSRCARGPAARVDRRVPSREIHPIRSTAPHHHHHAHAPHAHAPLALRLLLRLAQRVSLHPIPTPRATRDFARACVRARVVGGLATARLAVSHRRERDEKRGAMRRALRCGFFAFWLGLDRGGGWGVGAEAQSVSASVLARFHISAVAFSAGVETFPLHMPACTLSWLPSAPQATLHPLPGTDFRVGAPDNKGMVKPK